MDDIDEIDKLEFSRELDARLVELSKHRNIPISELREEWSKFVPELQKVIQEGIDKRNTSIWSCMCNLRNRA
jgi:hypothetical protein